MNAPTKYLDRQRCEAAGLEYGRADIEMTLGGVEHATAFKNIQLLDALSAQLSLQSAAFLESQYERAGVISGGGAKEPEATVAALCAPWMDINLLDPEWQKKWDAAHPKK